MNILTKHILRHITSMMVMMLLLPCCILTPNWPSLNPSDLWVSDEPNIWFEFDEEEGLRGKMVSDGEVINIEILLGPGPRFDISRYPDESPDDKLVRGECNFSQNEGTVYVREDMGNVLGGAKTITFVRQERDTETEID